LMAQYNLTAAEIKGSDAEERIETVDEQLDANDKWVRLIWFSTANLNFCKYYYSKRRNWLTLSHHLIGTRANVASTKVMADYLVVTVNRLTAVAPIGGRQRASFRMGAANRLAQRMNELKKKRQQGHDTQSNGINLPALADLYKVHQHDNDAFYDANHEDKLKADAKTKISDAQAFALGAKAANTIGLETQITQEG